MENEVKTIKNKNLPNQLTIARVLAIPLFIVLLLMGFRVAATIVFILAAFTDMLRLELLCQYGGTWIDATVLCTGGEGINELLDPDLFVFQQIKKRIGLLECRVG